VAKIEWLKKQALYLEGIEQRAAKKLAVINTKRAKEYSELFPPTCPKPDPVPDLNVEIMQELAKFQVESAPVDSAVFKTSPADQVASPETNGEASYHSTSALSKGPTAKNPLGVRGLDAVQVST
jgi:hypothetical protein